MTRIRPAARGVPRCPLSSDAVVTWMGRSIEPLIFLGIQVRSTEYEIEVEGLSYARANRIAAAGEVVGLMNAVLFQGDNGIQNGDQFLG